MANQLPQQSLARQIMKQQSLLAGMQTRANRLFGGGKVISRLMRGKVGLLPARKVMVLWLLRKRGLEIAAQMS